MCSYFVDRCGTVIIVIISTTKSVKTCLPQQAQPCQLEGVLKKTWHEISSAFWSKSQKGLLWAHKKGQKQSYYTSRWKSWKTRPIFEFKFIPRQWHVPCPCRQPTFGFWLQRQPPDWLADACLLLLLPLQCSPLSLVTRVKNWSILFASYHLNQPTRDKTCPLNSP